MIESRIIYEVKLNGYKINVTQGMLVVKKLQEPLDEGALNVPVTVRDIEYEMFGFLSVKIIGLTSVKEMTYFIQNDEVEPLTKDGVYTHNLTLIEYTYSYDTKLVKALTFTKQKVRKSKSPFYVDYVRSGAQYYTSNTTSWVPPLIFNQEYEQNKEIVIKTTGKGYDNFSTPITRDVFVRLYDPNNITYNQSERRYIVSGTFFKETILSNENCVFTPTINGIYLIEYGLVDFNTVGSEPTSRKVFLTYYINVISQQKTTLYDYIERIRRVVPLETKNYHEQTRLFNLEPKLVERFKSIEMPEIFITQMTLRQTLNTLFKFVNAIMRLEYVEDGLDILTIDEFNKVIGSFELTQMVDFKTSQNIQGYGTKITSWLENTVQANFRDNPTISTPASNYFKTVRAVNVQLNNQQGGFHLPLDGGPLYELLKLEVNIPRIEYGYFAGSSKQTKVISPFTLDLTSRVLEKSEWDLKLNTNNFPSYDELGMWSERVGLRENKGANIFWQKDKEFIDFSMEQGSWFSETIIISTLKESLAEYFTINSPLEFDNAGYMWNNVGFNPVDIDNFTNLYRNISFNIEYITLKSMVVKNHRSDISVINKDTEIRLNQSARITDFKLATKNAVGYLERMGVPNKEFSKVHTNVESLLDVAMQDDDGYVITQATYELNNDYIIGKYELTKDHIRLSEFMGIDRAFRAFAVPRNNQVYDRDEHYEDFIMVDRLDSELPSQNVLFNRMFVINAFKNLTATDLGENKISFAFVRTDGFSKRYKDEATYYKAIMTPVGSYGGEQALLFNFGFNSNIIVGDAIEKVGGNFFNDPIRYTDDFGRFEELWFAFGDIYFSTANFPPIGGTSETVFNKTYAYPLIQSNSNTFNQSFLVSTGVVGTPSYNPIIFSKDPSEVLRSMNYQVNILPVNYRDFVVGTSFFSKNRLVLNVTSIDKLWLYKYKDGTTHDMFDTLLAKTNPTLYSYDKIEIQRGTIGLNIVYVENPNGTSEIRLINNAVMGSNHTSWAIANDIGELLFASNINENGFKLIPRHFRPGIDPLSLQRDGNYDVGLLDILRIYTSYEISKFEFPKVDLINILQVSASYDILRSTDNEVDMGDTITVYASYDIEYFQFPLVNINDTLAISVSYNIVKSTDFVQGLTDTLNLGISYQIAKTENQIANFSETLNLDANYTVVKSTDFVLPLGSNSLTLGSSYQVLKTENQITSFNQQLTVSASYDIVKTEKTWTYIGISSATYDETVEHVELDSCPTTTQSKDYLSAIIPANTKAFNYIVRIERKEFGRDTSCYPLYYYFRVDNISS